MAVEIYAFDIVIPPATPRNAPVTFDLSMPARTIQSVEIVVPPGAAGNVGFRFASGGITMIPTNREGFIIPTPPLVTWPLEDQITSGAWQVIAYNTGGYSHFLQVRFLAGLLQTQAGGLTAALLANEALSAAPVQPGPADASTGPVDAMGGG